MCVVEETNARKQGGDPEGEGPVSPGTPDTGSLPDPRAAPHPPADAARPTAVDNPAQVAGTRDLLLAVMNLTVTGLGTVPWPVLSGEGARRAAHAR